MPCVNLANIRAYRSSLKAEKKLKNNTISAKTAKQNIDEINSIKPDRKTRRAERLMRKQAKKAAKLERVLARKNAKQANRAAKLEQSLARKAEKQALKQAKAARRFQRKLAKQAAKAAKRREKQPTQPAVIPEKPEQTYSDEPILLKDGDVIKIQHTRKALNLVYEPASTVVTPAPAAAPTEVAAVEPAVTTESATVEPPTQSQHVVYVPSLRKHPSRAELINAESRIGSQIFGPIPVGHRREFFHHQRGVWIWHEGWTNQQRERQELTVRYEVRLSGIYKKVAAGKYLKLEGDELTNFRQATHTYLKLIKSYLYQGAGN